MESLTQAWTTRGGCDNPERRWPGRASTCWPFHPASIVLAPLRMRKSAEEIEALRRAAATADTAVQAAWRACRPGVTEADIAAAVDAGFRTAGAAEVKSASVGSGPNSAFPHHHTGTRR